MRGIDAAGVYVPDYRLSTEELQAGWGTSHAGGIERKAVPGADEDALTMAIEAGKRALGGVSLEPSEYALVAMATTTPPLDEGDVASRLVRALGLPDDVRTSIDAQHAAGGAQAIASALDVDGPALVVVADCPEGDPANEDHVLGSGAAAFVIDDDPAVEVSDIAWHADELPGIRFRQRGEREVESLDITTYERNAIREAITAAIERVNADVAAAERAAIHQPDGTQPYRTVDELPIESAAVQAGTVVDRIGDAGAATVPIGLLSALATADDGEQTLAAFFGGGTAAACVFTGGLSVSGTEDLEAGIELSYAEYLRQRGYIVSGDVAGGGAHVSLPNWRRSLDQRYRLVAGRCPECGDATFPPEGACQSCYSRVDFETFEAPRRGTIRALTVIGQGGAPPEFDEQQQRDGAYGVAIVGLDADGDAVTLPAQLTDADLSDVSVGDSVQATIRRIYEEEGVPRYGVKFTPGG